MQEANLNLGDNDIVIAASTPISIKENESHSTGPVSAGLVEDTDLTAEPVLGQGSADFSVEMIKEELELFHFELKAYANIPFTDHKETWEVTSNSFKRWIRSRYHRTANASIAPQRLQTLIETIEAEALFGGHPEIPVFTRIGEYEGKVYIDLCNEKWEVVEIGKSGYQVITDPPVRFVRTSTMEALPKPTGGGSIDELRPLINVTDEDWPLVIGWLIAALRPKGPYPIAVLKGEQGSAKSTVSKMLKCLIDPDGAPLIRYVSERDTMITAKATWVLAFGNISAIKPEESDALCRLATGGGYRIRLLYTDADEQIINVQRPLILNGIGEIATRGDLLDRSIVLETPVIPPSKRKSEKATWEAFEQARSRVLGALYTGVSQALRDQDSINLPELPRLADAAIWITAAELAMGTQRGSFLKALKENQLRSNEIALESSPFIEALRAYLLVKGSFHGTATMLLNEVNVHTPPGNRPTSGWPSSVIALGNTLTRYAPILRAEGIEIDRSRSVGSGSQRILKLTMTRQPGVATVAPSQGIPFPATTATAQAVTPAAQPQEDIQVATVTATVTATVREVAEIKPMTEGDGCDGSPNRNSYYHDLGD